MKLIERKPYHIKQRLHDYDPFEVSLVRRGANFKKFLIHKTQREESMDESAQALAKLVEDKLSTLSDGERVRINKAVLDMGQPVDPDVPVPTQGAATQPMSPEAQAAMNAIARIAVPFKEELTPEVIGGLLHKLGKEPPDAPAEVPPPPPDPDEGQDDDPIDPDPDNTEAEEDEGVDNTNATAQGEQTMMQKPQSVTDEAHAAAMTHAKSAYKQSLAAQGYKESDSPQPPKDAPAKKPPVDKKEAQTMEDKKAAGAPEASPAAQPEGFSAAQKQAIEEMLDARTKGLVEKNAKLEADLATEREAREDAKLLVEAQKYSHLGDPKELAAVLKSATDDESRTRVAAIFKSAHEQIGAAKGYDGKLFEELGSSQSDGQEVDLHTQIEQRAKALAEKSGDSKKTPEQIYAQIMKSDDGRAIFRRANSARSR